jgi:hypothetical protein
MFLQRRDAPDFMCIPLLRVDLGGSVIAMNDSAQKVLRVSKPRARGDRSEVLTQI